MAYPAPILERTACFLAIVPRVCLIRQLTHVGKLRTTFRSIGREGDWDSSLSLGDPAASLHVKEYLKSVTAEQLQARVTPKQATPLFLDKLCLLSRHWTERCLPPRSPLPTCSF